LKKRKLETRPMKSP